MAVVTGTGTEDEMIESSNSNELWDVADLQTMNAENGFPSSVEEWPTRSYLLEIDSACVLSFYSQWIISQFMTAEAWWKHGGSTVEG